MRKRKNIRVLTLAACGPPTRRRRAARRPAAAPWSIEHFFTDFTEFGNLTYFYDYILVIRRSVSPYVSGGRRQTHTHTHTESSLSLSLSPQVEKTKKKGFSSSLKSEF